MNPQTIFQVDAFADQIFKGNPAAVCPLEKWPDDELLLNIARENNLSETAFFVIQDNHNVHLRWFTPEFEIDLCGHATLATSHVLFEHMNWDSEKIVFHTKSGELTVEKQGNLIGMDFPSRPGEAIEAPKDMILGLGSDPNETYKSRDYMAVYDNEDQVKALEPDFHLLSLLDCVGIIATAPSNDDEFDFISRFFAPRAGVNEDPVTGSAHSTLTPYWSKVLGKDKLKAKQISRRGGVLELEQHGERIKILGKGFTYLKGEIYLP